MIRAKSHSAFTFVEVLAAMVFVAIVVPVIVHAMSASARLAELAERKRTAVQLADMKLTELARTGDWREAITTDEFGEDWPGFRWSLEDDAWQEDSAMRALTLTVYFAVAGREESIALSSLVEELEE
ncbi:MAG: type II secretion system protein [Candidatus Sumerlaeia bacterium]